MTIYAHNNLFIQNKYHDWYFALIAKARTKTYDEYSEVHHIVPDSLGGSDDPDNLIRLSYPEHFLCHWLLIKFVKDPKDKVKMIWALNCMTLVNNKSGRIVSSWQFDVAKRLAKDNTSGVNSPGYGKKWYNNGIKAILLSDDQEVPEGFDLGRLPVSEEFRRKIGVVSRGKKRYNNGEIEILISSDQEVPAGFVLGRLEFSAESRRKIGDSMRGKKWYNNGTNEIYLSTDQEIPEGFVPGRLEVSDESRRKLSGNTRGKKRYNNGYKEILLSDDQEVPAGFVSGRLPVSDETKQ
jgi:hypothetical protein